MSKRNNIWILAAGIFLIIAVLLTTIQVQNQQELRQRADENQTSVYFAEAASCSTPLTSLPLTSDRSVPLYLCLKESNDYVAGISGFNIIFSADSDLTFQSIEPGPNAADFNTPIFQETKDQNKTVRLARINTERNVTGTPLSLLKLNVIGTGKGTIAITTAEITSLTQNTYLSVAKTPLSYDVAGQQSGQKTCKDAAFQRLKDCDRDCRAYDPNDPTLDCGSCTVTYNNEVKDCKVKLSNQYFEGVVKEGENYQDPGSVEAYCERETDCVETKRASCIKEGPAGPGNLAPWLCSNNLWDKCHSADVCDERKIGSKTYYCNPDDRWKASKPAQCDKPPTPTLTPTPIPCPSGNECAIDGKKGTCNASRRCIVTEATSKVFQCKTQVGTYAGVYECADIINDSLQCKDGYEEFPTGSPFTSTSCDAKEPKQGCCKKTPPVARPTPTPTRVPDGICPIGNITPASKCSTDDPSTSGSVWIRLYRRGETSNCEPNEACWQRIPPGSTPGPTAVPTATPRILAPTGTPAPTPTPLPGSTQLALTLTQQGLFNTPVNRARDVTVVLEGPDGKTTTKTGKVTYSTGAFAGTINLGVLPTGSYDLLIKSGNYLKGFVNNLPISETAVSAQALLAVGLDDQANIAAIPVLYAAGGLKECFGSTLGIKKCTTPEDVDLDGDGNVDRIDYNIYFLGITNLSKGLPVQ